MPERSAGMSWRKEREQLDQEVRSHLEMAARDRVERGQSAEDAGAAARREFGNLELVRRVTRDQWGWMWLEELVQDLRYGARMLRKNPGFTVVAVLTLALGIGANTAIFSVVNGVLLNPLPYPDPEQLVTLHESKPGFDSGSISFPNFRDWQKDNHTFTAMAISRGYAFSLTGVGEAEQLSGRFITSDFFSILDVKPILGRALAQGEDAIGAAPVALISQGLWDRKFSSRQDVIGKTITLDGRAFTIIGVIPASFDLQLVAFGTADVYAGLGQWQNPLLPTRGSGLGLHGIGRLKPGITIDQARADMKRVTDNLVAAYPDTNKGVGATMRPLRQDAVGHVQPLLMVLLTAVGFVLLIACVNVANLMLARSTGRLRELAIRTALGASRGRVVRQLLTECVLLALAGGALGLLLAYWSTQGVIHHLPATLPRAGEIAIDARVLIFTVAVSLIAGLFFGLLPALKTSQADVQSALKEGGRGSSTRHRAHSVFVVLEVALALILLAGAGLMLRTLAHLWSINPGFRPQNVLAFGLSMPPNATKQSPEAIRANARALHEKFASTPDVQAISLTLGAIPLASDDEQLFWLEGQPKPASAHEMNWALDYIVGPDYLQVMGIPLQRGRFFTARDDEHAPLVVVVDDIFAQKFFGAEDPLGKRIVLATMEAQDTRGTHGLAQIIGIVPHVNQWGLDTDDKESVRAQLYIPWSQMPDAFIAMLPTNMGYLVRAKQTTDGLFDALRQTSRQMSSEQVIYGAQTMTSIISDTLAARRFSMILLGIFAGLALVLSSIGIYGVVSYVVGQRVQEIGIRLALGARPSDVLGMVLAQGARMTGAGVAVGLAASLALTRLMGRMLYGVSPTDPLTLAGVAALLLLIAVCACYIPARRAMRVDPIEALRYE
jgi:predicted permease